MLPPARLGPKVLSPVVTRLAFVKFDEQLFVFGGDEKKVYPGVICAGSGDWVDRSCGKIGSQDLRGGVYISAAEFHLLNAFAKFT
jgi:hypothetical protein